MSDQLRRVQADVAQGDEPVGYEPILSCIGRICFRWTAGRRSFAEKQMQLFALKLSRMFEHHASSAMERQDVVLLMRLKLQ